MEAVTFNNQKIVKLYIVYKIRKNIHISDYPTLENCLFEAVSLTKNADVDRYKYSGYGIGFDRHLSFSFPDIAIIFGVHLSSSVHVDNKKKDILILGKGTTQGLEHTQTAEEMYSINFAEHNKKFCLRLHYTGAKVI